MMKHRSFGSDYSLADLENALIEYEGPKSALVGIGHQAGDTIGSYEKGKAGDGRIILRPGKPLPNPPGTVIDTDVVYITGQLQTITAYRGA